MWRGFRGVILNGNILQNFVDIDLKKLIKSGRNLRMVCLKLDLIKTGLCGRQRWASLAKHRC